MTGPQASYLETLAREAGEDVPKGLTKAEASRQIDRLRRRSNRVAAADGRPDDAAGPTELGNAVDE